MTRVITVYATVLAVCLVTRGSAEDLPIDKIVSIDQNRFKIRFAGRKYLHDARDQMRRANEYCAAMKQTVVVKDQTWDLGYGYTRTWSCSTAITRGEK